MSMMIEEDVIKLFNDNERVLDDYCAQWGFSGWFTQMKTAAQAGNGKLVVRVANKIWFALPDSMSIRDDGFFKLCDIAEHIFD